MPRSRLLSRERRKTLRRRGGAAFAGTQGCVVIPALKSKSKYTRKNSKYITKLYFKRANSTTDRAGADIMKRFDPTGEYTKSFYDHTEEPDLTTLTPEELEICKHNPLGTDYLYMENGGTAIELLPPATVKQKLPQLLQGFSKLADFLKLMSDNGYAHDDVHEGNIVFDTATDKMYLIDFGFTKKTQLNNDMIRLMSVMRDMLETVPLSTAIDKFITIAATVKSTDNIIAIKRLIQDSVREIISERA